MKKIPRIALFGSILWLICFAIGFIIWPLHESQFILFKTIMIVASCLTGIYLLSFYLKKIDNGFVKEGIIVGIIWFAINIILDLIVLVGYFKTPVAEYFIGIGLRYLNIPITSIGVGMILNNKTGDR